MLQRPLMQPRLRLFVLGLLALVLLLLLYVCASLCCPLQQWL
jgi:hypothetical protein